MSEIETEPPEQMTWGETVLVWLWGIIAVLAVANTIALPWRENVTTLDYLLRFVTTGLAFAAAWTNYTWTRFKVGSNQSTVFYQWAYLTGAFTLSARFEGSTFYGIAAIFSGILMLVFLIAWVSHDEA